MANTTIDTLQLDIVVNSNTATSNLKKTTNEINNLNNSIKGTKKGGGLSNIGKSLNFGAMIGKLYFIRNITKRLSDNLAKMVQYGIDFTETLNLWQTAMRGNVGEARSFIAEMNKAYGIAEATLMKYQATFKNMLSAMGKISEDTAYGLSEVLTKMALDFSSLYNVSIESAMTKFQAVLSGQVRPIRSISGYDITENTIFDLYKGLGGTKTMRQLNQTEKRLLRIYAVFTQMSGTGALGDLQKTLATNANQLRIMKEQAIDFATWVGNGISYLMQESQILVKLNSYLFTAKELAKSLAYELGYSEENFISGIFDSAEQANDEIDELQGKLLGFDKFQSLQDSGTGDVSVESALTEALKNYQSLLSGVVNPAEEKSVELLKQMGYELKVYAKLGEEAFEGTPEEYAKWLKTISDEQRKNVQMVEVWNKASDSLSDKITSIAKGIGGIISLIMIFKQPLLVLLSTFEYLYMTSEDFRESINSIVTALGGSLLSIGNSLMNILVKILPIISSIVGFVSTIVDTFDKIGALEPILWGILGVLTLIKAVQLAMAIIMNWKIILIGLIVGAVIVGVAMIIKYWTQIKDFFVGLWDSISTGFMKLINTITNGFISFINLIIKGLNHILNPISKVSEFFGGKKIEIGYIASIDWGGVGQFANGGGFNSADLFYANENGQTELIASNNSGGGAVMNMEQLQSAITRGMLVAMASNETEQTQNININVGSQNWFNITRKVAQQNGYDLVKVR